MAKKAKSDTTKLKNVEKNGIPILNFDEKLIQLLENFVGINPSIEFVEGDSIDTISIGETMYARSNINCHIPKNFVVNDLAKFLNVLSLFENHQIELGEHQIIIHNADHSQSFKLAYGKADLIKTPNRDEEIKLPSIDVSFAITKDQLTKLNKACSILGVTDLKITSKKTDKIILTGLNNRDSSSDNFTLEVPGISKQGSNVDCSIKLDDLKILSDEYNIDISNEGIAWFRGQQGQEYYIGVEA